MFTKTSLRIQLENSKFDPQLISKIMFIIKNKYSKRNFITHSNVMTVISSMNLPQDLQVKISCKVSQIQK